MVDYLGKVKGWLDSNPNEGESVTNGNMSRTRADLSHAPVISMIIVNSDSIAPSTYATAFDTAQLTSVTFKPTSSVTTLDSWPTLSSMIEGGGRMVVFMDYQADFNSVPWIIDGECDVVWLGGDGWEVEADETT